MANVRTLVGDCLDVLDELPEEAIDLIYLDPPFFTQRQHTLSTRNGDAIYAFDDSWSSNHEYARFLYARMLKLYRTLSATGSLFFHCDKNAVHIARCVLDRIFGADMFQSEIIWSYKRWSNSCKGLLPGHQNILFYAKTPSFKFHQILTDYSESTNLDQIVQKRVRDCRNKSVYARDDNGFVISNGSKKGVPLSDVWEIPYLNPKARERVGYPTQKPILLLEQIIRLCTDEGDLVLDPFCGSGTTLVAAKLLNRRAIGIDTSQDAIALTEQRLERMIKTDSALMKKGRSQYRREDIETLEHLAGLEHFVIQRNKGIDAILKQEIDGLPVFLRVQRQGERAEDAALALSAATINKGHAKLIVVLTEHPSSPTDIKYVPNVYFVLSTSLAVASELGRPSEPRTLYRAVRNGQREEPSPTLFSFAESPDSSLAVKS
jgi:site-specific DNA-methyltransferase (adenine-specific)